MLETEVYKYELAQQSQMKNCIKHKYMCETQICILHGDIRRTASWKSKQ